MNVAYKHLDSKLRIADLTIGTWIGVIIGIACGIGWGVYVSPFGPTLTLTLSIYLAGLPVAAAVVASLTELDPVLVLRSAIAWRRREGRLIPGPGTSARGYVVQEAAQESADADRPAGIPELDFASLWKED